MMTMWTQLCVLVLLTINFGLSDAGYCTYSHSCYQKCYKQKRTTTSCGLFWLWTCTKYRSVSDTCIATCYSRQCCHGYNGDNCDSPICFGSNGCLNGGRCTSPDVCECPPGNYSPDCADINECTTTSHGCQQGCSNTIGSFECTCAAGYTLDSDLRSCIDNNECVFDNGGCQHGCENTDGSYGCTCQSGYIIDNNGLSCNDVDECSLGIDQCSHQCYNTDGSYICSCYDGYYLDLDGYTCLDVDECLEGIATCDTHCLNTQGSYTCSCDTGYVNGESNKCQDIDECLNNVTLCDQVCVNEPGSFHCECTDGYELIDSSECVDIDECERGVSGCSDGCENMNGSFLCNCPSGYFLAEDNRTCEDVDDCIGVVCHNGGVCEDGFNTFTCSCAAGYTDTYCETDIDECSTLNGGCQDVCTNTDGSYNCSCYDGRSLQNDGHSCQSGADHETVFEKYLFPGQLLPQPCYEVLLAECTEGRDIEINLSSTSEWYTLISDQTIFYTLGISFVKWNTLYLPISLQGIEVSQTADSFEIRHSVRFNSSGGMLKDSILTSLDCESFSFDQIDMIDFIYVDSFTRTHLRSLDLQLPSWLELRLPNNSVISVQDMQSDLIYGSNIDSLAECSGAPVIPSHLYSVFRFKSGLSLKVLGDEVFLPPLLEGRRFCLIADLCMKSGATVFMMIPEESRNLLLDLHVFESLYNETGIFIKPRGIGISPVDGINVPGKFMNPLTLWNGDTMFQHRVYQFTDIWIGGDLDMHNDMLATPMTGKADVFVTIPDVETILTSVFREEWTGLVHASLTDKPVLRIPLSDGEFSMDVVIPLAFNLDVYMSIGGDQRNWCGMDGSPTGLYFSVLAEVNPFMDIPILQDWVFSIDQMVYVFVSKNSQGTMPSNRDFLADIININDVLNNASLVIETALIDLDTLVSNVTLSLLDPLTDSLQEIQNAVTDLIDDWNNLDIYNIVTFVDMIARKLSTLGYTLQLFMDKVEFIGDTMVDNLVTILNHAINRIQTQIAVRLHSITDLFATNVINFTDFGVKYNAVVNFLGLTIGDIDLEVVYSVDNGLFKCSRFERITELAKTKMNLRAIGRLSRKVKLGRFLKATKGVGFGGAFSLENPSVQNALLQYEVFASFLEIKVTCDVFLSTGDHGGGIYIYTEGNIFGVFLAQIDVSAELGKASNDWYTLTFTLQGRLVAKTRNKRQLQTRHDSFQDSYLDALKSLVNLIANDAKKRISAVQSKLSEAQAIFTRAQVWLEEKKQALKEANIIFDKAICALEDAKQGLRNARIPFENAQNELKAAKETVDNVCKIRKCQKICIPGISCKICYKRIWFVKVPYPCCRFTSCMISFPDPLCILANIACRIIRAIVYLALEIAHAVVRMALIALDIAEMAVTAAQTVVDISRVTLKVVEGVLVVAQVGLELAKGVLEAAKYALEAVKIILGAAAKVLEFVIEFGIQNILDVRNCGFNIELSTHNVAVFDVSCEINAFRLGWQKIQITINFKNALQSIWQAARNTLSAFMDVITGVLGRKRRDIEFKATASVHRFLRSIHQAGDSDWTNLNETIDITGNKLNNFTYNDDVVDRVQNYHDKCNSIEMLQDFLQSAFWALQDTLNESLLYRREIETVKNDLLGYNVTNITAEDIHSDDIGINKEYAINELNLTYYVIYESIEDAKTHLNDDPNMIEINKATNTSLKHIDLETEKIESIDFVSIWYTAMNNLTRDYFNDSECSSFRDCMFYTITSFYVLYEKEDFPNSASIRTAILNLESIVIESFQNESSTLTDTAVAMEYIVNEIDLITKMNPFCSEAPTITKHPKNVTILIGMGAMFYCTSIGDPDPYYWWFLNDEIVPGEHSTTFLLENITDADHESKINCMAGNIVANITSQDAFLYLAESDIDECEYRNGDCEHGCLNSIGSFECTCPDGYKINETDGRSCLDLNECTDDAYDGAKCDQICTNSIGSYNCTCNDGYNLASDQHSCDDINECSIDNGGCDFQCVNYDGSYQCICDEGYIGNGTFEDCNDVNECQRNNGGCDQNCTNTDGSFYCECKTGYELDNDGYSCIDVDECMIDHGGCEHVCVNVDGGYNCSCARGYVLEPDDHQCTDINECVSNNGGCEQQCNNTMGSFICSCEDGLQLDVNRMDCIDIDECLTDNAQCNQTCINVYSSYTCKCYEGYELSDDGFQCFDIDECATNKSVCEQSCLNTDGSFSCYCNEGFALNTDNKKCDDQDECNKDNGFCNHNCTNTIGSFFCSCLTGYILDFDGFSCTDVDECSVDNGGCEHHCSNTDGSYECTCRAGFELLDNGVICTDVDECSFDNGGCEHHCSNTDGSYECTCRAGFELLDNGVNCTDVDECSLDNGGCEHHCSNTDGSYECTCRAGFELLDNGVSCTDGDECSLDNGGCEHHCSNTDGSYECTCRAGFELLDNDVNCTDVDECSLDNGGCEHHCSNTDGSYECTCRAGYELLDNGFNCTDVDECSFDNGGCEHHCSNTDGSYECTCRAGFELLENGVNCTDVDECSFDNGGCEHHCSNTDGSYECTCRAGFELLDNDVTCTDVDECSLDNGGCEHHCSNTDGSYECTCRTGFELLDNGVTCTDVDECSSDNGGCEHHCSNTDGSYVCTCRAGYTLLHNGLNCTDVDACSLDNGGCEQNCLNNDGSYECTCRAGYELLDNGVNCIDVDECSLHNGGCEHQCTNVAGSFQCECFFGYFLNNLHQCVDIDECRVDNGDCDHVCVNGWFVQV